MRELQGKVAFITGGASGVGFALARALGRANMRVMVADIEPAAIDSAVAELKNQGIEAHGIECDVSDRAAVQRAAADALSTFGKVHVVGCIAGVACGGPIELITPGDWEWVIAVDVMGLVHCIQSFLPLLKAHGEGGHVITIPGLSGMISVPGGAPYHAAKFGVLAISESLAGELAGTSIGVSMICCGWVRGTKGAYSSRNRPSRYGAATETSPTATAHLVALQNSGAEPDKLAEQVVHGIRENELYIFTQPETRGFLEERFQRILAAHP
jgi:NAD(P)-dependent dehydrogenase (short-subunit alcohol dehydrogenase family)